MEFKRGRFSWLLRPFLTIYDVSAINVLAYYYLNLGEGEVYFFNNEFLNNKYLIYFIYSTGLWLISTYAVKFYKVYRYTSFLNIMSLLIKQFIVYLIIVFAFAGIFRSVNLPSFTTLKYLVLVFIAIATVKILSYLILKAFRSYLRGNVRDIIIIGCGKSVQTFKSIITEKKELGYVVKEIFCDSDFGTKPLKESFEYLKEDQNIDEIYCSIDELTEKQVNEYVKYANINHCNIKFIPSEKETVAKRLKTDYYGVLPVLSIQDVALNDDINKTIKRVFDIFFSLFIIVFILSWLTIILFILIKLDSKGPLFFKQKRTGINYKEFYCFKYRSLRMNSKQESGTYVKENDSRVTKVGKFLRKTSMDELPQFFNVLIGDMSVVGPRPHMLLYTDLYSKKINKYNFILRHKVKPGITGLAQVSGFRGEVKSNKDIIGRVKFDIFYIENWSLLLDLKIIFQTLINAIKGEDKAY
ncbi:exopolysaccharide biosynthesis polyprenyl glycosylphosphotransferase [Ichthyenterobacterium sp. W332]|uniref:Exopolysaccharide biosynthesis polyprenyl glycosylphosphotransferase n=1 Tax=Microcosmobacter mediterraneus TaxID=3075607 RepID=A0ABU2YLD9_9FLAO|nr:exopolysaccharide biosynthesis polyprenyl glycosylphosphotransferase [Ichthyenterobacterium sp. W332]MDT0558070.1 exopolysaccharide biosynthesis polyprenyl glycosylphosphotransferase [Ichthyenterobacterium sp. W332]